MAADLQDEASARALAVTAAQLGGGQVDILVNSAGLFPFGPTDQMTEADFDDVFTVNVKVPFYLVAGMGLYGASKAALVLLTKSWAAEFGPSGVRVSAVSRARPGRKAPPVWARPSTSSPPDRRLIRARRPRRFSTCLLGQHQLEDPRADRGRASAGSGSADP